MRKGISVVVFMGLLLAAFPARSTVLLFLDLPQLTQKSTAVIQGQVLRQRVIVDRDYIWTDSYVKVSETLKGKVIPGRIMVLRQLGGETATQGMKVAGMASFRPGEKVVVFARSVGNKLFVPVGACLGKFSIYQTSKGTQRVRRDFTGASFARFDKSGKFQMEETLTKAEAGDMALSELIKKISVSQAKGGVR